MTLVREAIRRLVVEARDSITLSRRLDPEDQATPEVVAFITGQLDRLPVFYRRPVKVLAAVAVLLTRGLGRRAPGLSPICRGLPGYYLFHRLVRSLTYLCLFDQVPLASGPIATVSEVDLPGAGASEAAPNTGSALVRERLLTPDALMPEERCQVLVIGSGPGGCVAAEALARAGRDVLVIEEGELWSQGGHRPVSEVTARLYRDGGILPILGRPMVALAEGSCVGGGSVVNMGVMARTPPWILDNWRDDLGLVDLEGARFERHFQHIEQQLSATLSAAGNGALPASEILAQGADALSWRSQPIQRAVKIDRRQGHASERRQCMTETYLPSALAHGARLAAGLRAIALEHDGHRVRRVVARTRDGRTMGFLCDQLVLACGPIQTAHLLRRSRLSRRAGRRLEFHMNLKIIARFDQPIHAEDDSIGTLHVTELEPQGILFQESLVNRNYLSMYLAPYGNRVVDRVLEDYDHHGIFLAQLRPRSRARVLSALGDRAAVAYRLDRRDLPLMRHALTELARLLFASGAVELYLPLTGSTSGPPSVSSLEEVERRLARAAPRDYDLVSVHTMASCPMAPVESRHGVVDPGGRLRGCDNVLITDASVLPTSPAVSPQVTVMALAHDILERHLGG